MFYGDVTPGTCALWVLWRLAKEAIVRLKDGADCTASGWSGTRARCLFIMSLGVEVWLTRIVNY